ncbi:MAG: DUF2225 domain-containing protein [Spirochaetes bacterium]|nr:DUF2225 domain-containing protein [Spirochaetota bacterium]
MQENENFRPKITYLAKEPTICPICNYKFFRESLLSGGGRLNADKVTETLHRLYKPGKKFGKIHPLIYSVVICPDCFYASLPGDFFNISKKSIEELKNKKEERIKFSNELIGAPVDFNNYRILETGAAGYALAILCYDYFSNKSIPVIKQAICSLRAAYLFEELETEKPDRYFQYVAELFYKKALFFYKRSIELNQSKEQIMETIKSYGPDIDKDYGYDSVIYLIGILKYKYGIKTDAQIRKKELEEARSYLGKLFGLGKADFDKPKEILEKSKDFHQMISDEIKEIDGK